VALLLVANVWANKNNDDHDYQGPESRDDNYRPQRWGTENQWAHPYHHRWGHPYHRRHNYPVMLVNGHYYGTENGRDYRKLVYSNGHFLRTTNGHRNSWKTEQSRDPYHHRWHRNNWVITLTTDGFIPTTSSGHGHGHHHFGPDTPMEELDKEVTELKEEVRKLRHAEKKEPTKLATLSAEVRSDNKEDKRLKEALKKEEAHEHSTVQRFHALYKKLRKQEQTTLREVLLLNKHRSRIWQWFNAVKRDDAPLRKTINRLRLGMATAKSSTHAKGESSRLEFTFIEHVISQLEDDSKELNLHRVPANFGAHMKAAKGALRFLHAAAHPHVWHHGYIYSTLDFANPAGDDDGGAPTNGRQPKFLSLPRGWQIAPASKDSKKVTSNFGWSTDCLTFSDGSSWYTSDAIDNGFCGKNTLRSNKKHQHRPKKISDQSRRILMRFPVPK